MLRDKRYSMTAKYTCFLLLAMSVANISFGGYALANRWNCDKMILELKKGSDFFLTMIYHQYIFDESCYSPVRFNAPITSAHTVFIYNIVLISVSCVNLLAIIMVFLSFRRGFDNPTFILVSAYFYAGSCIGTFVFEIIFVMRFGNDYTIMSERMNLYEAGFSGNYAKDTLRLAALFLMIFTLKGLIAPMLNFWLVIQLVYYSHVDVLRIRNADKPSHSIHNWGVIHAFDEAKNEDEWQFQPEWSSNFVPGKLGFSHSSPYRLEPRGAASTGRPFTYLATNLSQPSSNTHSWSQEPPLPVPIPIPDYSPQPILKSALRVPNA